MVAENIREYTEISKNLLTWRERPFVVGNEDPFLNVHFFFAVLESWKHRLQMLKFIPFFACHPQKIPVLA
jgi:hypothetical protein